VDFEAGLARLVELLRTAAPPSLVNQYVWADPALDHPDGPARRLANLCRYLRTFRRARYLLCAEAAGYNGARFSGVTFCDEVRLVGPNHLPWAGPAAGYARGSRDDHPLHRELSATIVWATLGERTDVLLWNCVPWHPAGAAGPLSNRPPTPAERAAGQVVLAHVVTHLLPPIQPIAVGKTAQAGLAGLGLPAVPAVRHPANGGATRFRLGLAALIGPSPSPGPLPDLPRESAHYADCHTTIESSASTAGG
jgi:hypothetical protein